MVYDGREPIPPWDRDLRRARALGRDEHRLRQALAAQEGRRFDLDTARTLRERTEDLLETVTLIAHDEDFWTRLRYAADEPPTGGQLERLREVDGAALTVLLEVSGYVSPPPPPVDELVDDTLADLEVALREPDAGGERVRAAQRALILFTWRVRRQVAELEPSPLEPSALRATARRLGRAARWLLPKVAAVSAGVLVESVVPGTGIGVVVGAAAKKVAEDGVELAAKLAAARIPDGTEDAPDPTYDPGQRPIHPVLVHSAALVDQLQALDRLRATSSTGGLGWPDPDELDMARLAARQLRRLEDVLADADRLDPDARLAVQEIRRVLDRYLGPTPEVAPDVNAAMHAAEWLAHRD